MNFGPMALLTFLVLKFKHGAVPCTPTLLHTTPRHILCHECIQPVQGNGPVTAVICFEKILFQIAWFVEGPFCAGPRENVRT